MTKIASPLFDDLVLAYYENARKGHARSHLDEIFISRLYPLLDTSGSINLRDQVRFLLEQDSERRLRIHPFRLSEKLWNLLNESREVTATIDDLLERYDRGGDHSDAGNTLTNLLKAMVARYNGIMQPIFSDDSNTVPKLRILEDYERLERRVEPGFLVRCARTATNYSHLEEAFANADKRFNALRNGAQSMIKYLSSRRRSEDEFSRVKNQFERLQADDRDFFVDQFLRYIGTREMALDEHAFDYFIARRPVDIDFSNERSADSLLAEALPGLAGVLKGYFSLSQDRELVFDGLDLLITALSVGEEPLEGMPALPGERERFIRYRAALLAAIESGCQNKQIFDEYGESLHGSFRVLRHLLKGSSSFDYYQRGSQVWMPPFRVMATYLEGCLVAREDINKLNGFAASDKRSIAIIAHYASSLGTFLIETMGLMAPDLSQLITGCTTYQSAFAHFKLFYPVK